MTASRTRTRGAMTTDEAEAVLIARAFGLDVPAEKVQQAAKVLAGVR